jgi:hypothetical protein
MQSPDLTPTPSASVFIPPDSPTDISESRLSGTSALDDHLGARSLTTPPAVIARIEPLRRPLWPAFVIAVALLLSLLWSGTLVWLIYRMCHSVLS